MREEWGSEDSAVHGECGRAGWRARLPFGTPRDWPSARSERMGTWGEDTQLHPPQFGSQGRRLGGCVGPEGVGGMGVQASLPHINFMGTDSGNHAKRQTRNPFLDCIIPGVLAGC